jgi:glycosyltransferase involved in cell wall biosynthesis
MTLSGKRVLYLSYNGMLDPLGQSQVIPYVKGLSKLGLEFTLLSFERAHAFGPSGVEASKSLREDLSSHGIEWHVLRYHQKPSLPATAYDVTKGIRYAGRLMRKKQIQMVHARAHIPAVIALALKRRFGAKMIFDVRGLMAEEYIDAGHWKPGGVPARITKSSEARVLRTTDGIVTLTDVLWAEMRDWPPLQNRSVTHLTIPCCVDLDKFRFDEHERAAHRAELGIGDRFVLVYSGSVGGWYMTDEMAAFFANLKQEKPSAFFLWLTHGPPEIVRGAMEKYGIEEDAFEVRKVSSHQVPGFLNCADAGIAFYRPGISRLGTSPVKVSEYLACGLPVVMNTGIGDSDRIIEENSLGILVGRFDQPSYEEARATLDRIIADTAETRTRIRATAEKLFDLKTVGISRYAQLYEELLDA